MDEHCGRVWQRLKGLFTEPIEELLALQPESFYSYFEFIKSYFLILIFIHPFFSLLHWIIFSSAPFNPGKVLLVPLLVNFAILVAAYLISFVVSTFGFHFGISEDPVEYAAIIASVFMPFMAMGVFRIVPWIYNYLSNLSVLYAIIFILAAYKKVYDMDLPRMILFLLLHSFFLMCSGIIAMLGVILVKAFI